MDPLRCGAGEAGAFHPLWKLCKQYEQKPFAPAFPLSRGQFETGLGGCYFDARNSYRWRREFLGERGLNSLFGHASLRIPLGAVSRPAQG